MIKTVRWRRVRRRGKALQQTMELTICDSSLQFDALIFDEWLVWFYDFIGRSADQRIWSDCSGSYKYLSFFQISSLLIISLSLSWIPPRRFFIFRHLDAHLKSFQNKFLNKLKIFKCNLMLRQSGLEPTRLSIWKSIPKSFQSNNLRIVKVSGAFNTLLQTFNIVGKARYKYLEDIIHQIVWYLIRRSKIKSQHQQVQQDDHDLHGSCWRFSKKSIVSKPKKSQRGCCIDTIDLIAMIAMEKLLCDQIRTLVA